MNLHESQDIFLELIQATAMDRSIPAIHVEKDYWVTRVLKRLSESEFRETVVFKGGTSLSKAHRLIERFPEDIDLAIRGGHRLGSGARSRAMKDVEVAATQDMDYMSGHPLETRRRRVRRTAYAFPTRSDAAGPGQVVDSLLLEINSFPRPEPSASMPIATLIHDFLVEADRVDLIRRHELTPFSVLVLSVERTLCEKIISLVRAGHESDALAEFRRRIRHLYDIVMILRVRKHREFVESDTFVEMISEVREWDRRSMPGASAWLDPPLKEALIVADAENLWNRLRLEFRGSFRDMVYGDSVPEDDEVLECLALIGAPLARVRGLNSA